MKMTLFDSIIGQFGIARMPWVARVYLLLLLIFGGLLVFSVVQTSPIANPPETHPAVKLFSIASDGLKTVLGALIGSLSLAAERYWGQKQQEPPQAT